MPEASRTATANVPDAPLERLFEGRPTEVRLALVLYGGVSLAVYINGTAREFFDLVRGRGVWGLVQELAGADVTVDVISGASAGGINGLFLAYALCGEREFGALENLWRDRGGFQRLVRRANETDARSLLDSAYMDRELQLAFREMDRKPCDTSRELGSGERPKELDCFLAVTNFDGHYEHLGDFRDRPIQVKSHAARLHVKHRRHRWEPLSGAGNGDGRSEALSPKTLASFARATSAFPVAFEPVILEGEDSGKYFDHRGPYLDDGESAVFIDGGVLDNKPFTPMLPAIYGRHTDRPVERLLFFVEPDPPEPEVRMESEAGGGAEGPNFLQVAIASLSSLPGYESIADDLKALDRHNRRLDLLSAVFRASNGDGVGRDEPLREWEKEVYRRARLQSLMDTVAQELSKEALVGIERNLLAGSDEADEIARTGGQKRFSKLFDNLCERLESGELRWKNLDDDLDVDRVKRAYYYWIYRLYEELAAEVRRLEDLDDGSPDAVGTAERRIARLSSTMRFLSDRVDMLLVLEARALKALHLWSAGGTGDGTGGGIEGEERFTLDGLLATWRMYSHGGPEVADVVRGRVEGEGEEIVGRFADHYRRTREGAEGKPLLPVFLDTLKHTLLDVPEVGDSDGDPLTTFRRVDARRFPAILLSGLGEMDRIDYVRISARDSVRVSGSDPALERWDDDPMTKVTGRQLGHFGAFLKRSWRSNDIMWGRQDAATVLFDTLLLRNGGKLRLSRRRARRLLQDPARLEHVDPCLLPWLQDFADGSEDSYRDQCQELLRLHQKEIYRDGLCTVIADAAHEELERRRNKLDLGRQPALPTLAAGGGSTPEERFQAAVFDTLRQFKGNCRDPLLRRITDETLPSRSETDLDTFFAKHYQVGEERVTDLDPIDLTDLGLHATRVLSNMTRNLLGRGRVGSWVNRKLLGRATVGLKTFHLAVRSIRSGTFPVLWFAAVLLAVVLLVAKVFTDTVTIPAWVSGGLLLILLAAPGIWFGRLRTVRWIGFGLVLVMLVVLGSLNWNPKPLLDAGTALVSSLRQWVEGPAGQGAGKWWQGLRLPGAVFVGGLGAGALVSWWWQRRRRLGRTPWWRRLLRWSETRPGESRAEAELRARNADLHDVERRLDDHRRRSEKIIEKLKAKRRRVGKRVDELSRQVADRRDPPDDQDPRSRLRAWFRRLRPARQ